jgi:hypothetical protein
MNSNLFDFDETDNSWLDCELTPAQPTINKRVKTDRKWKGLWRMKPEVGQKISEGLKRYHARKRAESLQ